jgi:hypothetical protein
VKKHFAALCFVVPTVTLLLGLCLLRGGGGSETPGQAILPAALTAASVGDTQPSELSSASQTALRPVESEASVVASSATSPAAGNVAELVQDEDGDLPPGARVDRATIVRLHGDQPLNASHTHVQAAIEVKNRNEGWILALPSVVGAAVGLNDQGEVALVVYTKAETSDVPKVIDGLPVVTWKTGPISSQQAMVVARPDAKSGGPTSSTTLPAYRTLLQRPVQIGVSTSLTAAETPGFWTAGTIGCRVVDGSGNLYALSCFHVYSWDGTFKSGLTVLQPGTADSKGTIPDDQAFLGTTSSASTIVFDGSAQFPTPNTVDAAIASAPTTLDKITLPDGYGTPAKLPAAVSLGMSVSKYGRTTGYTFGVVSVMTATIKVGYQVNGQSVTAMFVNQIGISKPSRRSPAFSASGDSGSLVVTQIGSSFNPVGLLFAGSSTTTFANTMDDVLKIMKVSVDGN